jgi:hypothetical protein
MMRRPVTVTAMAVGVFGLLAALLVPWGSTGGSRLRWFVLTKQDFTDDDLAAFRRLVADLGKG